MISQFSVKIMTFTVILFSLISCSTAKKTNDIGLLNVEIEMTGRGSRTLITAAENKFSQSTVRESGVENEKSDTRLKTDGSLEWDEVCRLVGEIDLSRFENLEAPTGDRLFDGARTTVIKLDFKDKTLTSAAFDEGKPPVELKPLYDYLVSVVNQ